MRDASVNMDIIHLIRKSQRREESVGDVLIPFGCMRLDSVKVMFSVLNCSFNKEVAGRELF